MTKFNFLDRSVDTPLLTLCPAESTQANAILSAADRHKLFKTVNAWLSFMCPDAADLGMALSDFRMAL